MNRQILIAVIAVVLLGFVLFQGAVSLLCKPTQKNSVAQALANAIPEPKPSKDSSTVDPLSWDPVLIRLVHFLSKACPQN